MSRHHHSKHRYFKSDGNNFIGASIIIFILIFSGFIAYEYWSITKNNAHLDKEHCKIGTPDAITVILIDHTDTINLTQKIDLERKLLDIIKIVPKNSKVKIYSVTSERDNFVKEEISLCNPGDDSDISSLTGNKQLAQKRYLEKFILPLHSLLNKVINAIDARQSPIMKSIQAVNILSFQGEENKSAVKTLYLVSDLLEYDSEFSLYTESPNYNNFKKSPFYNIVKTDLKNVNVNIFLLNRKGSERYQNSNLLNFWENFLYDENANLQSSTPIRIEG